MQIKNKNKFSKPNRKLQMSHFTTISNILTDLQHPHITDELINEIVTNLHQQLIEFETNRIDEQTLYELVIHYCPELR